MHHNTNKMLHPSTAQPDDQEDADRTQAADITATGRTCQRLSRPHTTHLRQAQHGQTRRQVVHRMEEIHVRHRNGIVL